MNPFRKNAMNYGAILGMILALIFFVQYFLDLMGSMWLGLVQYVAIIGIISWACIYIRNNINNGVLSYGRALGMGTLVSFFGSIILAFFTYIFYTFIDPKALDMIFVEMENQMYNQGMSDSEIEMAIEVTRKMMTPLFMSFGTILGLTFWGFLFSLITSAFVMKKGGNGFNEAMKEISNEE